MDMILLAVALCAAFNVCAFALFGTDKRRAERGEWRVPERMLWLMSVPMSALGGLIGMHVFHHKTQKPAFKYGMPALLAVQVALGVAIYLLYAGVI